MILLARHGETDDNRPPIRVQGHRDVPLNDAGREQARSLGQRVEEEGIRAIYASPLARAWQTAEIVGAALDLEPIADRRLMESHRGAWEGRTLEELAREEPDSYAAWEVAGEGFRFPGGESLREHSERVVAALRDIRHAGPLPALVVCHGGTIRLALCDAHGQSLDAYPSYDVPNGALIRL